LRDALFEFCSFEEEGLLEAVEFFGQFFGRLDEFLFGELFSVFGLLLDELQSLLGFFELGALLFGNG